MARHLTSRAALVLVLGLVSAAMVLAAIGGMLAAEKAQEAPDPAALRSVLPEAACGVFVKCTFVRAPADTFVYYAAYRAPDTTALVGYAVTARKRGYSSSILTLAGVALDGRIVGMKILSQKETPKSGAKIVDPAPVKSIADVVKGRAGGSAGAVRVAVEVAGESGVVRCIQVEIMDPRALSEIEKALAVPDSSAVADLAIKAFRVAPEDTLLRNPARAVGISKRVIEKLGEDAVPWWQQQFIGKTASDLVVTKEKTGKGIQAVTGATISSTAVTESVKAAIITLGEVVGGFNEAEP